MRNRPLALLLALVGPLLFMLASSASAQNQYPMGVSIECWSGSAWQPCSSAIPSGIVAANSTNSTNLKASAGTVYGIQTGNINATTPYYLKLYDKSTAPTCGTDTPVKRILIPPNNSGNNAMFPVGIKFSNGIGYCVTAGIADSDTTAVPAATVLINIDWN